MKDALSRCYAAMSQLPEADRAILMLPLGIMDEQAREHAADTLSALSTLRALQVNGFDPLAAARDYPRLEDECESLRAENARLREALESACELSALAWDHAPDDEPQPMKDARAALAATVAR